MTGERPIWQFSFRCFPSALACCSTSGKKIRGWPISWGTVHCLSKTASTRRFTGHILKKNFGWNGMNGRAAAIPVQGSFQKGKTVCIFPFIRPIPRSIAPLLYFLYVFHQDHVRQNCFSVFVNSPRKNSQSFLPWFTAFCLAMACTVRRRPHQSHVPAFYIFLQVNLKNISC